MPKKNQKPKKSKSWNTLRGVVHLDGKMVFRIEMDRSQLPEGPRVTSGKKPNPQLFASLAGICMTAAQAFANAAGPAGGGGGGEPPVDPNAPPN